MQFCENEYVDVQSVPEFQLQKKIPAYHGRKNSTLMP